jgi:hypothetical protein
VHSANVILTQIVHFAEGGGDICGMWGGRINNVEKREGNWLLSVKNRNFAVWMQ